MRQPSTRFSLETDSHDRPDGPWFWPGAIPNDCVGIYGGSSGAPVFAKDSPAVSAVVSTALDLTDTGCGYGKPCEIKEGQTHHHPGRVYLASVAPLIAAFKTDGSVDLTLLDQGSGIHLERIGDWTTPSGTPSHWNVRIGGAYDRMRFKTGYADQVHCGDPKGYGPPQEVASQPLLSLPMPQPPGVYAVCAVGRSMSTHQWQPFSQATIKLRRIE